MINVELRPEAYALVREGVTLKSRKSAMYKVLMPKKLVDQLSAMRDFGENISDVILRLAEEAKAPASCGAVR